MRGKRGEERRERRKGKRGEEGGREEKGIWERRGGNMVREKKKEKKVRGG